MANAASTGNMASAAGPIDVAAVLELEGRPLPGTPWLDEVWVPKIGRPLWSAHIALAEVRVDPAP